MSGYSVSYKNFATDPERIDIYLIELTPYDPIGGAEVALYYATDIYVSGPSDSPARQPYQARASVALNVEQGIVVAGTVRDTSPVSGGEIRLVHAFGSEDGLASYSWNGRTARIIHVGYSPLYDGWVSRANGRVIYDGETESALVGTEEVTLALRTIGARLQSPIQSATLLGAEWMLRYDGVNVYAETAGPEPKLDLRNDFTAEFFIYLNSLPSALSLILGWRGTTYPWGIFVSPENRLRFRDSSSIFYTVGMTFEAKRWYHVAVACDSSGTNFYIHDVGTGVTTAATDTDDNTGRAAPSSATFGIGGSLSAGDRIDGYITQARVWSRKRTESEITEARFRRLTTAEALDDDLVGLWRGEDGTTEDGTNDRMGDASQIVTTQATITADETGGVYSFNRASGNFTTDGWVAGMRGLASGFGTAGNNGLFTVTIAAATKLTITGLTLVDEASVTTALLASAPLEIAGTTNIAWHAALEGSADQAGTLRPLAYGRCESVPGVLVSSPYSIYMVSGNECESIDAVYAGGVLHDRDTAYTDLVAFLAATTDPAKYDTLTCDMGTFVRFGGQPSLPVTIDVRGDNFATAELGAVYEYYQETAAGIAWKILTQRGPYPLSTPNGLDYASFVNLDELSDFAPCGIYCFGDETIADAVGFVLGSVGAAAYFSRLTGEFTVVRFGGQAGTSDAVFDERLITRCEPVQVDPPIYAVVVNYRRQYLKLEIDEIAGVVLEADDPVVGRLTQEYATARSENLDVLAQFPRAGTLVVDTGLALEADAIAEAQRQLALYGGAARGYKITVADVAAVNMGEGNTVEFTLAEYDEDGQRLQRLGLTPGDANALFIIMHIVPLNDESTTPQVEITLWRAGS